MIESFCCHAARLSAMIVENQANDVFVKLNTIVHDVSATHRAGRFRFDSDTLYSFSAALHSVPSSFPRANWFKKAWQAACIASAALILCSSSNCSVGFGTSSHIPVVCRSHGGVSSATFSMIAPFLQKVRENNPWQWAVLPDLEETIDCCNQLNTYDKKGKM